MIGLAAQRLDQAETIHARHVDVGDHQIGGCLGGDAVQRIKRMNAVFGLEHPIPHIGERGAQEHSHAGRIVHGHDDLGHELAFPGRIDRH